MCRLCRGKNRHLRHIRGLDAPVREMNAEEKASAYSEIEGIREEVLRAKRLYARHRWPVIDVTRKSVEETAAAIITKLSARQNR